MTKVNEKNKNIEMLTGDPKVAIRKISIPMMFSMILIMAYNLADSIWVAGLGADALAAIGFITPLFMILVGLGHGIGAGANSVIARYIGSEDIAQANNAGLHAILLSIVVSIIVTAIMILGMVKILNIMQAGETIKYALDYGYIIFAFLIMFVFSAVLSAVFRAEGDMKRAVFAMALTSILNIILDPIFIYHLNLGIAGAAWATIISSAIACIIMVYWIWFKKDLYLDLRLKNYKYDKKIMLDTLHVAIPSTLENIIFSLLAIFINSMLVVVSGTDAVAVYTASMRMIQLCMIPMMAIGTALLTIAGVAYGADNYKNLKIAFNYSVRQGFIVSIILAIILFVFSKQIGSIFSYTAASAGLAGDIAAAIGILCFFVIAIPHGIMASMTFQGVGKGTNALVITLLRSLILETVCAYIFGLVLGLGVTGIYIGVVVGCFLGGTIGYFWAKFFIRDFEKSCKEKGDIVEAK